MRDMIVTYRKAGADEPQTWEFDPKDVSLSAADVIERRYDVDKPSYSRFLAAVQAGSARARRVLLWYLLWRDHPMIRFEDVDPRLDEIEVEYTKAEVSAIIDEVNARRRQDPAEKAEIIEALHEQLDSAPEGQGKAE